MKQIFIIVFLIFMTACSTSKEVVVSITGSEKSNIIENNTPLHESEHNLELK